MGPRQVSIAAPFDGFACSAARLVHHCGRSLPAAIRAVAAFIAVILVVQIPAVRDLLAVCTTRSVVLMARMVGF